MAKQDPILEGSKDRVVIERSLKVCGKLRDAGDMENKRRIAKAAES